MRTEIVFILDASGSMSGLEPDTVGGFNAMIAENREEPGEAIVSTILFNEKSRVLHDRVDIRKVPRLTRKQYRCYGCTALLDAVGGAIKHVDLVQSILPDEYRADRVLFAITTDGMENASRTFTYPRVKRMIEEHRERGWEFLFIGANMRRIIWPTSRVPRSCTTRCRRRSGSPVRRSLRRRCRMSGASGWTRTCARAAVGRRGFSDECRRVRARAVARQCTGEPCRVQASSP